MTISCHCRGEPVPCRKEVAAKYPAFAEDGVELTEDLTRAGGHSGDLIPVADVAGNADGPGRAAQLVGKIVKPVGRTGNEDQAPPFAGGEPCCGGTDPGGRSGDQKNGRAHAGRSWQRRPPVGRRATERHGADRPPRIGAQEPVRPRTARRERESRNLVPFAEGATVAIYIDNQYRVPMLASGHV
jgi:hypothetical protein